MSFSTISTFSSLKFFSSGVNIVYVYPNLDGSMSIYYTFDYIANNSVPNYYNANNGKIIYDANVTGNASNSQNYIIGNGSLQVTNTTNTTATQYVQNIIPINTSTFNNCLSISVWFNPSSLSTNNLYTLFDIVGNVGNKGIQVDLSGTNAISYGYYDKLTTNLYFNVDSSMSIYYPLNSAINAILPNFYNALNSSVIYDSNIIGNATITNNTADSIIGNGALRLSNISNPNLATQYIQNTSTINTTALDGITISVWFNPGDLSNNKLYTLFDIASSIGNKGIQLDLSGTNMICGALYY